LCKTRNGAVRLVPEWAKGTSTPTERGVPLVFARSTPLVTSTPPEQVTNQSGYVTLTMIPRSTFPLKRGYHVQFFLRTRKDGEPVLAGVSSRRLAQVATA